ncbi:polysaccharide deacetylase family protein [Bdellovibrio reynosensis]|uniref:Polysaccharide deacetylase n=1 Tax=Bdellovibrio reynosensis TaxID=2835041 RepID=A0ABY4C888_9BACT|nr:hypothetical protein [Bdellovibrio reynosensis]UOF00689.1 hypothetical protein MNR06_13375 [Bdellovibrio reynosensis]
MFRNWQSLSMSALLTVSMAIPTLAQAAPKVPRPTQYVMVGFDGGLNLTQWQATRAFAADMAKNKKPINFTYFISGVYLLREANRHFYAPPKHDVGYSQIGFGANIADISARIDMINDSFIEGHEIASRANGNFNGMEDLWNQADWESEFRQWNDFIFGAYFNNGISPNTKYPQGYALSEKDIVGFRAPYLAPNEATYPALKAMNMKYDVSTKGEMTVWPNKDQSNIWRIHVPMIELAGTGRRITGMDYNFYAVNSGAKEDLANREVYRKQMVQSYMNYFNLNYYGRRAPVTLGHHLAQYNGGAYWDALKDFTSTVCGMPEVKCVSYKAYVTWLDTLTPDVFKAYRSGQFDMMPRPRR